MSISGFAKGRARVIGNPKVGCPLIAGVNRPYRNQHLRQLVPGGYVRFPALPILLESQPMPRRCWIVKRLGDYRPSALINIVAERHVGCNNFAEVVPVTKEFNLNWLDDTICP